MNQHICKWKPQRKCCLNLQAVHKDTRTRDVIIGSPISGLLCNSVFRSYKNVRPVYCVQCTLPSKWVEIFLLSSVSFEDLLFLTSLFLCQF